MANDLADLRKEMMDRYLIDKDGYKYKLEDVEVMYLFLKEIM